MKKYIAELIGTYALVFFGTGAIIVNDIANNSFGLTGIAIAFGLVVTMMIYTFGSISGAHINPAVSIAFYFKKDISLKNTLYYILFQIIGAILASLTLKILFTDHQTLGMTLPSGSVLQSFIMEIISTFFLMLVILGITEQETIQVQSLAGILIGATVTAMIFTAGPISGGSFNPARSIGPAIVAGNFQYLWLYVLSPILGALVAVLLWKFLKAEN